MRNEYDDKRPTKTVRVAIARLDAVLEGPDGEIPLEAQSDQWVRDTLALYDETGEEVLLEFVRKYNRQRGRPPLLNHATAIRRMRRLMRTGRAKSRWKAALIAAEDVDGQSLESTARRFYDEYKKEFEKNGVATARFLRKVAELNRKTGHQTCE